MQNKKSIVLISGDIGSREMLMPFSKFPDNIVDKICYNIRMWTIHNMNISEKEYRDYLKWKIDKESFKNE